MVITKEILNGLTEKAKNSERLRANLDLRNTPDDNSQRMLNALEPGTLMPIHRHKGSSETCVCVRGRFEEYFYDKNGNLIETIDMVSSSVVLNIEKGLWHSLRCLESGTYFWRRRMARIGRWSQMKYSNYKSNGKFVKGYLAIM